VSMRYGRGRCGSVLLSADELTTRKTSSALARNSMSRRHQANSARHYVASACCVCKLAAPQARIYPCARLPRS
jgi:hypothetical protein